VTTSSWITLFQCFSLGSSVLAVVSLIGLWIFTTRLENEKDTRINQLAQRVDTQGAAIVSATATVDASLEWDALGNSNEWKSVSEGTTGYVAFGIAANPLLIIRSRYVIMKSSRKGEVLFTAWCDLNAPESRVNGSLNELRTADIMQIGFPDVPDGTRIVSGTASVTINGNRQVTLQLQPQAVADHRAVVRDLLALRKMNVPTPNQAMQRTAPRSDA